MNHISQYLGEIWSICDSLNHDHCEDAAMHLVATRLAGGRVFVIGCGGSAANASHFVNDLRKLCKIEAYAPTDNVAHLTALTNDVGWTHVFTEALRSSNLTGRDLLFVLSVGGGNYAKNISANISSAMQYASQVGCKIVAIVGKEDGDSAEYASVNIVVPQVSPERITPHAEEFQSVICHMLVSHPALQINQTTW